MDLSSDVNDRLQHPKNDLLTALKFLKAYYRQFKLIFETIYHT